MERSNPITNNNNTNEISQANCNSVNSLNNNNNNHKYSNHNYSGTFSDQSSLIVLQPTASGYSSMLPSFSHYGPGKFHEYYLYGDGLSTKILLHIYFVHGEIINNFSNKFSKIYILLVVI